MNNTVEYYFCMPIEQLIYKNEDTSHVELIKISDILDITINLDLLLKKYSFYKRGSGDILVFFNKNNSNSFIMFDLYRGYSDQHDMVKIGVRCFSDKSVTIKHILSELYEKGEPRSKFIEDMYDNLKNSLCEDLFPKEIKDHWMNRTYQQHIEYYVDSVLNLRK